VAASACDAAVSKTGAIDGGQDAVRSVSEPHSDDI